MRLVLNETDVYRELAPPVWARGAVACFWVRRGEGRSVRVLPDGCTDIVWRTGGAAIVAGPDTSAWMSPTRPGELIMGARLLPGAGGAALGVPLAELRDTRVPLDALGLGEPVDESTLVQATLRLVAAAPPGSGGPGRGRPFARARGAG